MSKQFKYKCDKCQKEVYAKWNGEHWLCPEDWMQIYNPNLGEFLDIHLCSKCLPKIKVEKHENI